MSTTNNKHVFFTPAGALGAYPYLTRADDKFGDPKYHCKLSIPADAELITQLEALAEQVFQAEVAKAAKVAADASQAQGKKVAPKRVVKAQLPWSDDLEVEGNVVLKAKLNAGGTNKTTQQVFTQAPKVYDHKNLPWDSAVTIYGGSIAILQIEAVPYNTATQGAGITLRLKAARIERLAERQGSGNPFGAPVQDEPNPFGAPSEQSTGPAPVATDYECGGDDTDF